MNTNKNQKIALIAGAVILAIVIMTSQLSIGTRYGTYKHSKQVKIALYGGGVVAVFTFVAFIVLKTKD